MATGDKVYIADKATLDAVNQKAASLISTLNTVDEKATQILNKPDNFTSGSYLVPTDISQGKLVMSTSSVNSTNDVNVVNRSGPGIFYGLMYKSHYLTGVSTSPITSTIQLNLDGVNIYVSEFPNNGANSYYMGIITDKVLAAGSAVYMPGSSPVAINSSVLGQNSLSAGSNWIYLPKPVRFESSLRIIGRINHTQNIAAYGTLHYIYELD